MMNKNIEDIIKKAEQGDAHAQHLLAEHYIWGKYVNRDLDLYFKWNKLAAEQGHVESQRSVGRCYYNGFAVEQNYNEAVKWFKASGWYEKLGLCYLYGHGVEQNFEEAVKYFTEADDKEMLGECYLHGLGVERNINKTIELWETASEERTRYYNVMLKLGHLYGDGIEMEPNYEKALHWWYQLAINDSGEFGQEGAWAEAMYQLACYYYEGKGIKKSIKRALKCFKYTIDLFYDKKNHGEVWWEEYNRDKHVIESISRKIEGDISISDEPDFIIHARKILIKHGDMSIINKTKKAAQNGDKKAVEILQEFGIEFTAPVPPEPAVKKVRNEIVFVEKVKREKPIQLTIGETVTHRIFGEGRICEADGDIICVEFAIVGKKNFLNPEAFSKGFLTLERLI